jgi:hypothetical protein
VTICFANTFSNEEKVSERVVKDKPIFSSIVFALRVATIYVLLLLLLLLLLSLQFL